MSWMFTRFLPEFVNLRVTMLDDVSWFAPFIETWTKTKLTWATTPAVYSYEEFPPIDEYAKLSMQFSERLGSQSPP